MAKRNGCADVDALALCHCLWRCIQCFPQWRNFQASRIGSRIRIAPHYRLLGYRRRAKAGPTALLRLRQFCFPGLPHHRAGLSVPNPRRARISHPAFVRCDLAHCDVARFRGIDHSRAWFVMHYLRTPMPYGLIVLVVTIALAGVYVFGTDASLWSKALVTGLLFVSFLWRYGFFLRVALGI